MILYLHPLPTKQCRAQVTLWTTQSSFSICGSTQAKSGFHPKQPCLHQYHHSLADILAVLMHRMILLISISISISISILFVYISIVTGLQISWLCWCIEWSSCPSPSLFLLPTPKMVANCTLHYFYFHCHLPSISLCIPSLFQQQHTEWLLHWNLFQCISQLVFLTSGHTHQNGDSLQYALHHN